MKAHILLLKENRAGEKRVALVPDEIQKLVVLGHHVFVEHEAGKAAGFPDQEYKNAGAIIRFHSEESVESYKKLFEHIDILVRAKRPERNREILENAALRPGMIMIGALDPFENNALHMEEYKRARIIAHSIDQLDLKSDDPMNLLSQMSKIAGKFALLDAIQKHKSTVHNALIIGYGRVGQAAFQEATLKKLNITVVLRNQQNAKSLREASAKTIVLNDNLDLIGLQKIVENAAVNADIVITSIRKSRKKAPILIPTTTLQKMKKGSVIVDMALSEGGNVEGSQSDTTLTLGNGVLVTNVSGYPKATPHESSLLWSKVTFLFIESLKKFPKH